jgi:hypothetical protein
MASHRSDTLVPPSRRNSPSLECWSAALWQMTDFGMRASYEIVLE